MRLIEAMKLQTSIHADSSYEEKTIDIGLLVKDYLYIYNYLSARLRENIQYSHPLYTRALEVSYVYTAKHLNWVLLSDEYDNDLFSDMSLQNQERQDLSSISNFILKNNGIEIEFDRRIYEFTKFSTSTESAIFNVEFPDNDIEETISERLFIIEDYIDTQTNPEKCENLKCYQCIFERTCLQSDLILQDIETPNLDSDLPF